MTSAAWLSRCARSRRATRVIRPEARDRAWFERDLHRASVWGLARITEAVVFHEGGTLIVLVNALRLLGYKDGSFPEPAGDRSMAEVNP